MTKEKFIDYMQTLKAWWEYENKLAELDINIWERPEYSHLLERYIYMLGDLCHDTHEDIMYFIYDQEWGALADTYFITLEDGTEIRNHTVEELWSYILSNHSEIDEDSVIGSSEEEYHTIRTKITDVK